MKYYCEKGECKHPKVSLAEKYNRTILVIGAYDTALGGNTFRNRGSMMTIDIDIKMLEEVKA